MEGFNSSNYLYLSGTSKRAYSSRYRNDKVTACVYRTSLHSEGSPSAYNRLSIGFIYLDLNCIDSGVEHSSSLTMSCNKPGEFEAGGQEELSHLRLPKKKRGGWGGGGGGDLGKSSPLKITSNLTRAHGHHLQSSGRGSFKPCAGR